MNNLEKIVKQVTKLEIDIELREIELAKTANNEGWNELKRVKLG